MINVTKTNKETAGGCNGCSTSDTYKIIYEVALALERNGMSIRLCNDCKKELIKKLRTAK